MTTMPPPPPGPDDVRRIAATSDPVVRNLQITLAYYDISRGCRDRVTAGANWCTFATWASQQAGHTIRGEDLLDNLKRRSLLPAPLWRVDQKVGRWLVRRGLFNPDTRLGRLATAVAGPLQGLEAASRQIADGNRKVFEEIGAEFARFLATRANDTERDDDALETFCATLRPGPPPDGQDYLKAAFRHYYAAKFTPDPAVRSQREYLGNVLIGFHEQIRLQPQIQGGMTDPVVDELTWGGKLAEAIIPGSRGQGWRATLTAPLRPLLRPVRAEMLRLIRDAVTAHMMSLTVAGRQWVLSHGIDLPPSPHLETLTEPELVELLAKVPGGVNPGPDVGATDWADFGQRMRYIGYLFRVYHQRPDAYDPPFSDGQIDTIRAGQLPAGQL